MGTLDDAAEQLLVKLKGLDSEIEESLHALDAVRERMDGTATEVDGQWSALADAVRSLVERAREEQERLTGDAQRALDACGAAGNAVQRTGGEVPAAVAGAVAQAEALAHHVQEVVPPLERALAGGEQAAHALGERARALEEELARLFEEAGAFLRDDVAAMLGELAEAAYADWEERVACLEEYVATRGFLASHEHARAVVDWALAECRSACEERLSAARALVVEVNRPLDALASAIAAASATLAEHGATLLDAVAAGADGALKAQAALDSVERQLASYSFMGA
jgi:hypothetical protein